MRKSTCVIFLLLGAALTAEDAAPPVGWTATAPLAEARANSCAVRLAGNRVLVAGGTGVAGDTGAAVDLASAEIFSSDGTFASAAPMSVPRSHFTCTPLADGTVLAAGGSADGSVEIYDPVADAWTPVATAGEVRSGQTAVLLTDGRVLLAGGVSNGDASATLEVFDPRTQALTRLDATLIEARQDHAASLLPDGTVLLMGGRNGSGTLGSVEIFDPSTGAVAPGAPLSTVRNGHSATALDDGRVLVAGGSDGQQELDSAEIFDPSTGIWTVLVSHLNVARRDHLALFIPGNGSVLLAGGLSAGQPLGASEVFLPIEGTFLALGSLTKARTGLAGSAFDDGAILAAGGANAGVPQTACGLLFTTALTFSAATFHPQDTAKASGVNFPPSTTLALTLDLQGAIAGSTIASAQGRLLTTSVTTGSSAIILPTTGFGPVNIFAAQLADAGQTFRLTAKSAGGITASITAPVKVKVTLAPPALNPAFEGTTATFLVQLIRDGNPGPMTGTLTASLGTDVRTAAVNTTASSLFLSFQKTNVPAGRLPLSFTYSGDAQHEAASATASFVAVSRTPQVSVFFVSDSNSLIAGVGVTLVASVAVSGPVPNPPVPTGTVAFSVGGPPIGTVTLSTLPNSPPGTAMARLPFTPLTTNTVFLSANYSGDSTYHGLTQSTLGLSVQRSPSSLGVTAPATFTCGVPTNISAVLSFAPTLGLINRTISLLGTGSSVFSPATQLAQGTLALSTVAAGTATATITAVLPKNQNALILQFDGDSLISPTTTPPVPIHVQPVPVNVQFTSTPQGGGVTLSAVVNAAAQCGPPGPTGTVAFQEGTTTLAAVALPGIVSAGLADGTSNTINIGETNGVSVTVARPAGAHTFVAHYGGDQFHQAQNSAPITVTFQ